MYFSYVVHVKMPLAVGFQSVSGAIRSGFRYKLSTLCRKLNRVGSIRCCTSECVYFSNSTQVAFI